ncbi:MAG TPA: hypothetical protein VI854_08030, partial [Acidimicrobiia bacterium]|nr:hypothetical protein [Acidimicrobiia bacterium]
MNTSKDSLRIVLTAAELSQIRDRLLRFTSPTEPALNRVLVTAGGGGVSWVATDSYRMARLPVGTAVTPPARAAVERAVAATVPVRTLVLAWQMCERRDADTVTVDLDGDEGVLRLPGVELPFDASTEGYPHADDLEAPEAPADEAVVTLAAEDLLAAIHGAALHPQWLEDGSQEQFVVDVAAAAGVLRAVATWGGHPDTAAAVSCTASRDVRVGVNPRFLYDMAEAASDDVLTLHLSESPSLPLRVEAADGFAALVMPCRIGVESARPAFEAMLAEVLGIDADELARDDDGDYLLPVDDDEAVYVRLVGGSATTADTAHVFSVLAAGVAPTAEALGEINDL